MPTKDVSISDSGSGRDSTKQPEHIEPYPDKWWRSLDSHERKKVYDLCVTLRHIIRDIVLEEPDE